MPKHECRMTKEAQMTKPKNVFDIVPPNLLTQALSFIGHWSLVIRH